MLSLFLDFASADLGRTRCRRHLGRCRMLGGSRSSATRRAWIPSSNGL